MENPLIEIKNAEVYVKGTHVLSSINWTMRQNENWAMVGNNGAGKTTFMKLIFGELIPVYGGEVHWFGHREHRPLSDVRKRIGFVSAEYQENYSRNITGWQVAASGFFSSIGLYDRVSEKQKQGAFRWMEFLGIRHLAQRGFHQMSYGEARRVLLARALVNHPELLILDEPCAGLDIPTRELFLETLGKLSRTRTRLIYVTHHIDEIMPFITHVIYLKGGKVARQGRKREMLTDQVISDALDCRITLKENLGRYWIVGSGSRPGKKKIP